MTWKNLIFKSINSANVEIENARKSGSSELAVLSAQLKKSEMKVASLERTLVQKVSSLFSVLNLILVLITPRNDYLI